ncbi:MAG: sigma-70 family RNA polymerase sigma factor [Phycisphaerales bacterium]|nr:MAG: sigma-70 family RNA polymerase sigma factor [Phycisphaerales bacterium]
MMQDKEVVRRILAGDTESFRLIVERYQRPVVRVVRNITFDGQACEDIAQEVFLAAYRKLSSYDPARSSFSTWLFTIARNKSINALRKKKAVPRGAPPDRSMVRAPQDELVERELLDELDSRLRRLPARQRRAFVLAEFEGLSYEEIAQIERTKTGTIKSRISRAREKLKSAIRQFSGET